jgi:hypothetical protein
VKQINNKETISEKIKQVRMAKSLIFLAAFLSMIFSIFLFHSGDTQNGIFVGIWVPSILSAGSLMLVGYNE